MSKTVRYAAFALLSLVLIIGAGALYIAPILDGGLPETSGTEILPGLSHKVSIIRDDYGVPHIFASNMNDAARALGYTHASDRFFQMEMQRRAGQGRLSEIVGKDMIGVDKFIRTLNLYALAQSSATAMSPEAKDYFQAYADGVNAWLDMHKNKLPPEFTLLGAAPPEPWVIADSVVWGKLMALQLSHNYKLEILRGQLAQTLSHDQMNDLFPMPPGNSPITTAPHSLLKGELVPHKIDALDRIGKVTGLDHGASNEWVISGSRTETGKPILANDPHLSLEAPILWYLVRIVTPDFTLKGASVPGLPIVLLGQNDHIAWGFTTTGSDVQDLFVETIDAKNPGHYLTPKGSEAFSTRDEVIHVKGSDDVTLHVRATRHGPVMSDIDDDMARLAGENKVMALAFTGLGDKDLTSEALMHLNRAKNWPDFLAALRLYQAPPQNVVYADTAGNIGFINPGLVPVRKKGDGLMPADGASGDNDWVGNVPFAQLPQLYNPPAGFVFNANNAVPGLGAPYFYGVDWEETYRAQRLQQFFDTIAKHSLDSSAMMQADDLSLAAKQFLPYLVNLKPSNAKASDALQMLKNWDGRMDKNKAEPLIFEAWLYQMHKTLLADKTKNDLREKGPFAASTIASIISNQPTSWCADDFSQPPVACDMVMTKALDDALGMLDHRESGPMQNWTWGHEHITELKNKVFSHVPFLKGKSDLSVASSGDFYTLNRGGSFDATADKPFARNHGGGFRGIYDLGDPDNSRFMITTGESGNIFSNHYGDLVPLWNDVKSIPLAGSEDELRAAGLPELVLQP